MSLSVRETSLYWTQGTEQGVSFSHLDEELEGRFCGVSPPFHLDAVFTSRLPFIVEFSNIINIEI